MDLLYKQSHHEPLPCGGIFRTEKAIIINCNKYSVCVHIHYTDYLLNTLLH